MYVNYRDRILIMAATSLKAGSFFKKIVFKEPSGRLILLAGGRAPFRSTDQDNAFFWEKKFQRVGRVAGGFIKNVFSY